MRNHKKRKKNSEENSKVSSILNNKISEKKIWFIVFFLLTIGVAIFYAPLIKMEGVLWNDFIEQYLPYRIFATHSLKKLIFPFWNPYCFSGMPFFSDIQSAVLYPLNLLMVLFSSKDGFPVYLYELQILFHLILAGFFTYILSRDFERSRSASFFASIIYMFGGFATAHIFHVTMIHTFPYFPAALFTLKRALSLKSVKYIAATSICICIAAFAGHPQMYLYLHYLLVGYFLYYIILIFKQKKGIKEIGVAFFLFFLAIGIGNGLSSVQLLPTYKLSKESVRPEMGLKESAQGSFRPYRFITLISPNFYSTPNNYRKETPSYWGLTEKDVDPGAHYYWETMLYIGIIPLIFSLIAIFFSRSPPVIFFLCIICFSLLIAMGDTTPLYNIAYYFLPGIKMFRNPCRIGILYTLSMSMLAAYGFDKTIQNDKKLCFTKRKLQLSIGAGVLLPIFVVILFYNGAFKFPIQNFIMSAKIFGDNWSIVEKYATNEIYPFVSKQILISAIFIVGSTLLLLAYLYNKINNKKIFITLILLFTFIDLMICGYGFAVIKIHPTILYKKNHLIDAIKKELKSEFFRINSRSANPGSEEIGGSEMLFRRNEGWVHEIFLVEGYNPLRLKRQLIDRKPRTLDILNVKYKIDVDEDRNSIGIVFHPTYLPRARIVSSYRVIKDEKNILPTFHSAEFDHINEIILEEEPSIKSSKVAPETNETKAKIIYYSLNKIVTEVETKTSAFLVLSEIYYPAWKAYVDGQKTKVFRANYALRAIPISAGKHTVVCKYEDDAFKIGLTFSLISFV
ncbi:MAG: YfhO family protein, partial [Chitinispirillaceae bacterium]|nr:YfhO family protein [Chitinispirillaceae bacterium]